MIEFCFVCGQLMELLKVNLVLMVAHLLLKVKVNMVHLLQFLRLEDPIKVKALKETCLIPVNLRDRVNRVMLVNNLMVNSLNKDNTEQEEEIVRLLCEEERQ